MKKAKKTFDEFSVYYDEVFACGKPRPHYRALWKKYSALSRDQKLRRGKKVGLASFQADAEVLSFPRILPRAEYRRIAEGINQRGRALQLFLHDHYFGGRRYLKAKIVPAAAVTRMLRRSGETQARKILRPEHLQFLYAPDLIRDPQGNFHVLEDNTGFIGGIGDLLANFRAVQALGVPVKSIESPLMFYRKLAGFYRRQASLFGDGKVVMLSYPPWLRVTHEDQRLQQIFRKLGIEIEDDFKQFQVRDDLLLHRGKRVSYVVVNLDTADIEPASPYTRERYQITTRSEISFKKGVGLKNFWQVVKAGKVGLSYSPGIEFVNDKEFYGYVEALIRFYLNEQPILTNIETISVTNRRRLSSVFAQIDAWVVKAAVGKGGEAVWVGRKLNQLQIRKLKAKVARSPDAFIAQRHIEPSRVVNHSVDLRPFAMIATNETIVSATPWGRAIPVGASGKVNISGGGKLTVIAVLRRTI